MAHEQNRRCHGSMYGPTVGDRIRLADTDLSIEVENTLIPYGDESNVEVACVSPTNTMCRPSSILTRSTNLAISRRPWRPSPAARFTPITAKVPVVPVQGTRVLRKHHMVRNAALPVVKVNPETHEVTVDGERAWCEPMDRVPMNQLYFL